MTEAVGQGPRLGGDRLASIERRALLSLAAQHLSVTWTQRTSEFASYLFLIDLFPDTLLPSALYGFFTTFAGVVFGGNAGALVDHPNRLQAIRTNIVVTKLATASIYILLLILLVKYPSESKAAGRNLKQGGYPNVWTLYAFIIIASCITKLSDISMSVAIERDWVMTISGTSDAHLTRLNLWMRRIDLGCKLVSPLFVGLLTSTAGNVITLIVIACVAIGGLGFELFWINIVWKQFPVLAELRANPPAAPRQHARVSLGSIKLWAATSLQDWQMFFRSTIFPSSMAISLLYFTTLSFDGTMIAWLKTNTYSDGLISGMRGISVLTGLAGTALMPVLESKIGLTRAGHWSIWSEVIALAPVLISFYIPHWYSTQQGSKAPAWNQALLFGGMALSRIGLWSFDLCQLKLLQIALADHPRRNTLNGLQFALQNILDLLRYVMVIFLSRPSQFKYTAVVSFGAVVSAAILYLLYLRRERGHLIHAEWFAWKLLKWS
ncbi:hypothetical protein D9619_004802 [Psilocybe cf. subviscida]|uniref:Solute carrier family 40 member n=1 Tax=Psilocybe cf. subviscida TaxID=2480587 RepID=A0A8H5BQD5_9AGAR|nr:hypothetical protein D9619_004802 [Psilocybe cf. subviscida]